MTRRMSVVVVVVTALAAGCGRLGTGLPSCRTPADRPTGAIVLSVQAVPKAEYIPCLNSLELGWEEVDFQVESGRATLTFQHNLRPFLEVALTESCDVGDAVEVTTEYEDVKKYEDVYQVTDAVQVTIIPEGERALIYALGLAEELDGTVADDRPVVFKVDQDIDYPVRSRINRAFFTDQYVWIIGDLDVDEETLEMRSAADDQSFPGIDVDDAVELIGKQSPDVQYRGDWYMVFSGGCITYNFDAEGTLATSIADDTADTIGLYPSAELIAAARRAGFDPLGE